MVPKALSPTKIFVFVFCLFLLGCLTPNEKKVSSIIEEVDVSNIPKITVFDNHSKLRLENGVYYFSNKPFSGYIKSLFDSDTIKSLASYYKGKQQGISKTFFPNGKIETVRNYHNGIAYGRHFGYWQNGRMKFDFVYLNDKREGLQKQWYESGNRYYELNFTDDRENGMQKAWRENGKLYINYEVKDGVRYGLQKAALCYTLKNERLK